MGGRVRPCRAQVLPDRAGSWGAASRVGSGADELGLIDIGVHLTSHVDSGGRALALTRWVPCRPGRESCGVWTVFLRPGGTCLAPEGLVKMPILVHWAWESHF